MSAAPIKSTNSHPTDSPDWSSIQTKVRKHLVWKEGRFLLPACIGLLVLVLLGMIAWGLSPANSLTDNATIFIGLALAGATMAALVCGSVTFSMERENRTDEFLARLPLSGIKLARVKIATATIYFLISYMIAVSMAVGLFALFFGGASLLNLVGSRAVLGSFAPLAFSIPGLCFLWSIMFSRYAKTTLSTVLSAAFAVLIAMLLCEMLVGIAELWGMPARLQPWLFGVLILTQIISLVYAIGRRLGSWLRPSSVADQADVTGAIDAPVQLANTKTSFVTSTRVLLWQTFRFHWLGSLIALLVCGLYLAGMLSVVTTLVIAVGYQVGSLTVEIANDIFAAALGGAMGLFLFSKDQTGSSFRFFQQRADYPRRIWLARIVNLVAIGLVVILAISIVNRAMYSTLVAFSQSHQIAKTLGGSAVNFHSSYHDFYAPMKPTEWSYHFSLTLRSATMFFVVAAAGQLVSIFCRHGILNALLGIACCSMAAIWVRYVNWYQVPAWSLAWPIGIAAFTLSWAYAPSWIRGTRQFRWSLASTLVMVGVSGACILGMRQDRLNDYPIQPTFADLDELYENPEKLKSNGDPRFKVAREIEVAISKIDLSWSNIIDQGKGSKENPIMPRKFTAAELRLAQDEQDAFEKIAERLQDPAARYYFCQSPDAADQIRQKKYDSIENCLKLYQAAARERGETERVRSALFAELAFATHNKFHSSPRKVTDLLNWADTEAQTSEEISPLIDQVELLIQSYFSPDNLTWLESSYTNFRRQLESHAALGFDVRRAVEEKNLANDLPWENERTKRRHQHLLLEQWNQQQQARVKQFGPAKSMRRHVGGTLNYFDSVRAPMRDQFGFHEYSPSIRSKKEFRLEQEFVTKEWLRYAQVRLALAAWRCDNQGYPEKLKELSPDYLASTFPTYYLKEKFSYHPEGLNLPVVLSTRELSRRGTSLRADRVRSVIPAKTPFLLPWVALPTEQMYFQIKTPDEQEETKFSTTDPALGYFMGQYWTQHNRSFVNNSHPDGYVLGRRKSAARDSNE